MAVKLGQNFLHDKNIARKIINEFLPQPGPVLEIGAGPGILSAMLLEKIPANLITLVEIDRFLAAQLRQRFGSEPQVIERDILEIDLAQIYPQSQHKPSADFGGYGLSVPQGQHKSSGHTVDGSGLSVPQGQVAIIGNLPYHISKALIDWFISQRAKISSAVLMLQKDFVDKLLAPAGEKKYNAQAVVFQLLFQSRRCFNVAAGAFTPPPRIMSTVLAVRPIENPLAADATEFYDFVRLCFSERRKTLWNNLAALYKKDILAAMTIDSKLSPQVRAEQLPPGIFIELFEKIKDTSDDFNR